MAEKPISEIQEELTHDAVVTAASKKQRLKKDEKIPAPDVRRIREIEFDPKIPKTK